MPSRFLTAEQLHGLQLTDTSVVVLDVRHLVGHARMRDHYEAGHIPGAIYVEMRDQLAGPASPGRGGRNPLPSPDTLQADLRHWGIGPDSSVVIYSGAGQPAAGRAWWVLTWAGIPGVCILAGGYEAWVEAGYSVSQEIPSPTPSAITVNPGQLSEVTLPEVPAYAQRGQLVDVRPRSDFELGHIPGAVNIPYTDLSDAGGFPLAPESLARLFEGRGVNLGKTVALTCGGGVAAAWSSAILDEVGISTALHVGSWSEWMASVQPPIPSSHLIAAAIPNPSPASPAE